MENTGRRIAVVSESSLEQFNGVSGSVKRFLGNLALTDHDAQVLTPKPTPSRSHYDRFPVIGSSRIRLQGFNVATPPSKRWVDKCIASYDPDIIQLHSPLTRLASGAIQSAQRLDVPTVAIYQTDVAQYVRRFSTETVQRMLAKQSGWLQVMAGDMSEQLIADRTALLHNQSTLTLAPSQPAIDRLHEFGVAPERIRLWGRGVDTDLFTRDRKETAAVIAQKRAWSKDGEKVLVGYVGRLAPEKQVERLESLDHPDVQLVVVGSGPSEDRLRTTLPEDTIFTGKLSGDELANAYASLDVFVHTGEDETFGQTLQEAMATELPVVAPANGGPLDIVSHDETGFLYEPGSSQSLRYHVDQLVADEELRMRMGQSGYMAVQANTWDRVMDQLRGYHDEAIDIHYTARR